MNEPCALLKSNQLQWQNYGRAKIHIPQADVLRQPLVSELFHLSPSLLEWDVDCIDMSMWNVFRSSNYSPGWILPSRPHHSGGNLTLGSMYSMEMGK